MDVFCWFCKQLIALMSRRLVPITNVDLGSHLYLVQSLFRFVEEHFEKGMMREGERERGWGQLTNKCTYSYYSI